jgi:peptidoglycan/LPS O-acetylase OafA/YrhL
MRAVADEPRHLTHLSYRPDIDGLRAVAVLSVVGFHAFPNLVGGGFIGVDIFFVISGYLISSIIFSSLERGSFSFAEFYARRIKRIFPALIVLFLACLAYGWFMLPPNEYRQLGKHIAAGAGFVANFVFWSEADYFDAAAASKPLLHLWSLGVEEQFYIFWPLLLWLVAKRGYNFLAVTLLIGIASFALNVGTMAVDATAAFYSPWCRFWELMMGGVLAHLPRRDPQGIARFPGLKSVAGLICIAAGLFVLEKSTSYPGWRALLPTLGAFLLIWAGPGAWINRTLLAHPAAVWVGVISYPLYLWHWPLLWLVNAQLKSAVSTQHYLTAGAAIAASVILAWLTYRLIERPLRFGGGGKPVVIGLVSLMIAAGAAGYLTYVNDGWIDYRIPASVRQLIQNDTDTRASWREHTCFLSEQDDATGFAAECLEKNRRPLLFLWGDSHAAALYPGLKYLQQDSGLGIAEFTASACPPLLAWDNPQRTTCRAINDADLKSIADVRPDVVLLHANWALGWKDKGYDLSKLVTTVGELRKIGIANVVLLGPVPQWKTALSDAIWSCNKDNLQHLESLRYTRCGLDENIAGVDQSMHEMAVRLGIRYISAYQAMCNDEGCLAKIGGDYPSSFDYGHLSSQASRYLLRKISGDLLGPDPAPVAPSPR